MLGLVSVLPVATRRASVLAALAALALMVGCAPPWTVIKQSGPPSALKSASSAVVSFDYEGMLVGGMGGEKPEAQWVAEKTAEEPDYPTTWADLKGKWESNFVEGFSKTSPIPFTRGVAGTPAAPEAAALTVSLVQFQLGKYIPFATKQSTVQVTHTWSVNGQVVDQIQTRAAVTPALTNPSIFQHIVFLGQNSGQNGGKFLARARK